MPLGVPRVTTHLIGISSPVGCWRWPKDFYFSHDPQESVYRAHASGFGDSPSTVPTISPNLKSPLTGKMQTKTLNLSKKCTFSSSKCQTQQAVWPRVSITRQRAVRPLAQLDTTTSANPARQAISGLVSTIYKATASFQTVDATLPPLWQALLKLDLAGVQSAIRAGQDLNQRSSSNDTPMLHIAREGHYKYPPGEIPSLLIQSGADLEAKDNNDRTALQVSAEPKEHAWYQLHCIIATLYSLGAKKRLSTSS